MFVLQFYQRKIFLVQFLFYNISHVFLSDFNHFKFTEILALWFTTSRDLLKLASTF